MDGQEKLEKDVVNPVDGIEKGILDIEEEGLGPKVTTNQFENIVEEFQKVEFKKVIDTFFDPIVLDEFESNDPEHVNILSDLKTLYDLIDQKYMDENGDTIDITLEEYEARMGDHPANFTVQHMGKYAEIMLEDNFNANKSKFNYITTLERLSKPGYPDMKITLNNNEVVFLEVKVTTDPFKETPSSFTFTPGPNAEEKINCEALHLLFSFWVDELVNNAFRLYGYKIVDVSKIVVNLNPKFSCGNKAIYHPNTLLLEKRAGEDVYSPYENILESLKDID